MTSTAAEIRHSARRLLASSGYSLGVLLTLTLGISLSVGMYTVLNGVLLASLPYPGGERVVEIVSRNTEENETDGVLTPAEAFALEDVPAFEAVGWYVWGGATVLSGDRPREITIHNVSGGYFQALGVRPQLGRWITAEDVGPERHAVVLSDAEWERLSGRDPDIIGRTLELVDDTVTVVGVMPAGLDIPVGLWRAANPEWYAADQDDFGYARYVFAYGRLAEGVDPARAAADLDAMTARVRDTYGLADYGWRLSTKSLLEVAVGDVRGVLVGVFVVSLVVLAIACANVGSLLAARMAARERELAIVQALGATSARVWRGVLLELLLLSVLATAGALLLLVVGLDAFRSLAADVLPRADEIRFTPAAFVFASGVAVLCPLLVAIPFGVRLRRRMAGNLRASGKGTGESSRGTLRALPVAGLALATTALVAGAAVALSLDRLREVDPGYRTENVYAVQLFHGGGPAEWRRFARGVITRMASEPDVENVALTTAPPLSIIGGAPFAVQVPGRAEPEPLQAGLRRVTPGYLDLVGVPLHRGRAFLETDDATAGRVAIVNETFARRAFGGMDVVGREIALPLSDDPWVPYRIVGVAADIRNAGLRRAPDAAVLIPFMQAPTFSATFLVHAPRAGEGLLQRLQQAVWSVDPREAMTRVYRLQDDIERELAQVIFFTRVLGGFALLAVLLAGFGTYSVIAFLQRRQVREIGVRLALGAPPALVARHVLAEGAAFAAVAGIAGSVAAVAVLRLLGSQLFGVGAGSPLLYVLGFAGVLLAALLASVAPAWRAARVQPMAALRYD